MTAALLSLKRTKPTSFWSSCMLPVTDNLNTITILGEVFRANIHIQAACCVDLNNVYMKRRMSMKK